MKKFLVEFSRDWADEFQAEGLCILTEEEAEKLKAWSDDDPEWYFGTNEGFECGPLTHAFKYTEITEEEEKVLMKLIPDLDGTKHQWSSGTFGQFPGKSYFVNYEAEE